MNSQMQTPARAIGERYKKCIRGLHPKRFPEVENDSVPADGINCR
jgi:hypothetical protein